MHLRKYLNQKELNILEKPQFLFTSTNHFDLNTNEKHCIKPIIVKDDGNIISITLNGNPDKMCAADHNNRKTQALVDKIIVALSELDQGIILKPGDFLSVDNHKNIHTRGEFHKDDLHTGKERHLIRTQTKKSNDLIQKLSSMGL